MKLKTSRGKSIQNSVAMLYRAQTWAATGDDGSVVDRGDDGGGDDGGGGAWL